MSKHTPGPWIARRPGGIVLEHDTTRGVAEGCGPTGDEAYANAARIVECVNALEGIADPAAFMAQVRSLYHDALAAQENAGPRQAAQLEADSIIDDLSALRKG